MTDPAGGAEAQAAPEPATPGELLRRERERRSLSVQRAAEELHLDVWVVEAIEANRFGALGAPVYARGHLRKYAAQLGLSPQDILQRYEALSDTPLVPTPIPASVVTPPRPERRSFKAPLGIAAGAIVLALGWWIIDTFVLRAPQPPQQPAVVSAVEQPASAPAPSAPPALQPATAAATSDVSEANAIPAAPADAPARDASTEALRTAPRVTAPVIASSASADAVRLRLEFREASWAEVYDAAGQRLMYDTGQPGRVRTLSGAPPLRITLGFASAVSAQVNGQSIVIPRRSGRDAAKFAVDAAGVVR